MTKVPNGVETFPKISSRAHERYRQTDDRQTDGRTGDSIIELREREFTFAKTTLNLFCCELYLTYKIGTY